MSVAETPTFTFEGYLEWEDRQERKHEFVMGHVYLMAGGTERHDLMTTAVQARLLPGARSRGCRVFVGNRRVRTRSAGYYPDLMVVCGKAAHTLYEADAAMIVEVLSPSTEDTDRREKAAAYAELPGLATYLLIDPLRRHVQAGEVGGQGMQWSVHCSGHVIATPFGDLDVDDLYDEVDATATT